MTVEKFIKELLSSVPSWTLQEILESELKFVVGDDDTRVFEEVDLASLYDSANGEISIDLTYRKRRFMRRAKKI